MRCPFLIKNSRPLCYYGTNQFKARCYVADVIAINKKMQLKADERAALIRKRKILAVRKVFHCTHCASKCEKCGTQIGVQPADQETVPSKIKIPYHFCESCTEEYLDYMDRLQGGGNPEYYWHNETWQAIWKNWIAYQTSIETYLKSKEFSRLLKELKQMGPHQ